MNVSPVVGRATGLEHDVGDDSPLELEEQPLETLAPSTFSPVLICAGEYDDHVVDIAACDGVRDDASPAFALAAPMQLAMTG